MTSAYGTDVIRAGGRHVRLQSPDRVKVPLNLQCSIPVVGMRVEGNNASGFRRPG